MIARVVTISGKEPRHLGDRSVEDVEEKLGSNPNGKHQEGHWDNYEFFAREKVRKRRARVRERAAEEQLDGAQKSNGGEKQAEHGDSRRNHREAESAFENQEFADEAV
jgi:hypothetical protein